MSTYKQRKLHQIRKQAHSRRPEIGAGIRVGFVGALGGLAYGLHQGAMHTYDTYIAPPLEEIAYEAGPKTDARLASFGIKVKQALNTPPPQLQLDDVHIFRKLCEKIGVDPENTNEYLEKVLDPKTPAKKIDEAHTTFYTELIKGFREVLGDTPMRDQLKPDARAEKTIRVLSASDPRDLAWFLKEYRGHIKEELSLSEKEYESFRKNIEEISSQWEGVAETLEEYEARQKDLETKIDGANAQIVQFNERRDGLREGLSTGLMAFLGVYVAWQGVKNLFYGTQKFLQRHDARVTLELIEEGPENDKKDEDIPKEGDKK